MAWCGRLLTWGLLAWAWRRLSWALVPAAGCTPCSRPRCSWRLNDRFHMAGEWVIGGVEAKGFAYVLVLLGLEVAGARPLGPGLLLFGAASRFHVIVGGWSVVAAAIVWLSSRDRPPLRRLVPALAGGLLLALPGLVPALALTWGVPAEVVREANRIYVYERLYHHLLPERFPPQFIVRHLLLVAALAGAGAVRSARRGVSAAAGVRGRGGGNRGRGHGDQPAGAGRRRPGGGAACDITGFACPT